MNFLAHIYLSGDSEDLITGNFIADFVKGNQIHGFSPAIIQGIELHRRIDTFTDAHQIVKQGKARLAERYRKYSPVIIDIFYDHFLASNWDKYCEEDLRNFSERFYGMMQKKMAILPLKLQSILPYMVAHNWLVSYSKVEGIQKALTGMSRRAKFESGMETATQELVEHYDEFNEEFMRFFPELIDYSQQEIKKLPAKH